MTSRSLSVASVAVLFFTVLGANEARAFCRMTTQSDVQTPDSPCPEGGEPLKWNNACLSYAIDRRASSSMSYEEVEAAVNLAFETWENVDCGDGPPNVIFKPSTEPSTCKRPQYTCGGNVNTIAFLGGSGREDDWKNPCAGPEDPPYDSNAFAVTIVWHNKQTGEILDADMMINDTPSGRFNDAGGPYADCPNTGCEGDFADLQSIVTHEAGHFIGIGHSDVPEATMFAVAERDSVDKRWLHPDDEAAICTIYPPGNLDQSCDATPRRGLQLNCEQDADGNLIPCSEGACGTGSSNGGCSASQAPGDAPWGSVLLALLGFSAWRRRRRAARS